MKLAAINDSHGTVRVHAATCADVKKEVTKFRNGDAYVANFTNRTEFNEFWWGDVATDHYAEGTPEWKQECADNGSAGTLFLPCCSDLPEDAQEQAPAKPEAYRYSRTGTVHTGLCTAVKTMLFKAGEGRLLAGWTVYPLDEAQADLVSGHSKDCSRCANLRRSEAATKRSAVPTETQGYFSAAAKVAHTALCPSMKAAAAGKLHIPLMKTGFKPLSVLLAMIERGEAKECLSCKKARHAH